MAPQKDNIISFFIASPFMLFMLSPYCEAQL